MPSSQSQLELLESLLVLSAEDSKNAEQSEQFLLLDIEDPNSSDGTKTIKIIL